MSEFWQRMANGIYQQGERSERRALEGAQVRRIFSSSPRDPRYHMLEHLSPKFKMPPVEREPRAALILNRFTRNLNIMFATNAVASVLGLSPEQVKDKSFYRCIQERCLPDALKCLESAKANDSIAYLRFWSRDPREVEDFDNGDGDEDDSMGDGSTSDSDDGGAALDVQMDVDSSDSNRPSIKREELESNMRFLPSASGGSSGNESPSIGGSTLRSNNLTYETPLTQNSPASAAREGPAHPRPRRRQNRRRPLPSIELEAVVSCTSDGLVVILRRARPAIPPAHPPLALSPWEFENGLFAAPWAQQPVRPNVPPEMLYTFQAPLLPQYMPLRENVKAAGGPPIDHLMMSIRDVAVFAWALVGINGKLAAYSHGHARGEAAPPDGLPIWDPSAANTGYQPPHNQAAARWTAYDQSMDKGKGPAAPQAAALSADPQYASSIRDLPAPMFAMPGYLQNPSMPWYQPSDHRDMPPPQYEQRQDAYPSQSNHTFAQEQKGHEEQAQSAGFLSGTNSENQRMYESPHGHDRARQ
ncbi:hypothetical protein N0V93_004191 [Gnomoniopsis smithogilvyi]|uniref:Uncharacterized protein n=1 Tax=Gnomoniopsis smithogilvyi TaxID=1191159 RepID=A0A9W8YT91_9PEZI|nr:hypothetical protein N0V93_004191 [Gnomoniopsis smithogilvyi]